MEPAEATGRGARVLVAGIGNIFLGDDGFGVEVVRRLADPPLGPDVDVVDFGIRGVHLAYELTGGRYGAAILVDAVPRGGQPGTLYAIEPDVEADGAAPDAHALTPASVLAWARQVGGTLPKIIIVGCEPDAMDESVGLSAPVAAAIDGAIDMVRVMAARMLADEAASQETSTSTCA